MRKYAIINNNKVTEVLSLEENEISKISSQLIIDIEDIVPQPDVDWLLDGNKLIPFVEISQEELERKLASKKMEEGTKIARDAISKVGARNKILNKTSTQITQLLTTLAGIKALLETGALGTARSNIILVKAGYPEYTDIFDEAINAITDFENKYGL